ncbi:MAG: YqiA/YcfP family alpha/beta fold hydrolase [Bacteroidota bacterium]
MNILYLHGLDSFPDPGKIEILESKGHSVTSLHLEYRKQVDAFDLIYKAAVKDSIEYVVASSVGGYYGYWLGHKLEVNQLLFNPAMPFRSIRVQDHNILERASVSSNVVLGANDETIPHNLNINYFSSKENARLVTCQWLGHRVDLQTFTEMINWVGL